MICFLGSLRNVRNFDGITCDSTIGVLIVCMTNEAIDQDQMVALKELVSRTDEGGLMILRYRAANELGYEQ